MNIKKTGKKMLSFLLCLTMLLACLPISSLQVSSADAPVQIVTGSKKADPSTIHWDSFFGPDKLDTEYAGGVWTDKSVFTGTTPELPGVTMENSDNFLVALSAIASNLSITGHTSAPTDTMLVLDVSGSMVNGTYQVGTIRQGYNNYRTVDGIDMSLINAMVDATNSTIDTLMKQNTNNRVGVVLYSGNSSTSQAATAATATVVLPLGRYTGISGEYLSVDTTYTTSTLYTYQYGWGGGWRENGQATYVAEGTAVSVSVKNGLKTEAGANVTDTVKQVTGGTYIQNGLYKAMNEFLTVTDTVVPAGRPQAGAERLPVIVLMSDGAPTIATTSFNSIANSNVGDGSTTDDRITFLTQLTAAYVRGRVAAKYQENEYDEKDVLFLTLGLGTENSSAATNTLYPAGSNSTLTGYWEKYLAGNTGTNIQITTGDNSLKVYRDSAVEAMNYVDTYYYANDAQSLVESFNKIVGEIELKAESYATLVENSNADLSGYVTFEDELGELMYVADMKGVLMSNGNGGTVLYTGKGIAESMTNGNLGTVDRPTDRGDELVRTVKERIPGITTTQAQQLIANAYADRQLYYADDSNWSNYIGWYADENGNYVGFWDKDSGLTNRPENAVYINKSYGYLGVNGDSDMMHVVVMVRTDITTEHQTVFFKIPASLLPTVQYKVTIDEDDPTVVEDFQREDAVPMQLVFEVGLRPDINAVNLEQKIAQHIQNGGHVHRNSDGTVTFYTNSWAIGNDKNQNGIPDEDEVDTAVVAESHFHPALDNSRYYYTENTPVLDASGNPVGGSARPTGTYYCNRYYYNESKQVNKLVPIAAVTLANKAQYDQETDSWYIPAGTMYHEVSRFKTDKTENKTGTLDYSRFPAVFENGSKQDFYTFLGNNGSITVAPAQGIALTKTIGEQSEEENAPTQFTFTVTLSQAVENPVITDTNGTLLPGIATVDGNQITVKVNADQTVVISGIPTGTAYTVAEQVSEYYTASSVNASGTVAQYTIHPVDFVNNAKGYGSLVVSKDVNYPEGFVPGAAHNGIEFTVDVIFNGNITDIAAPAGAVQNGNTFTLTLKDGQSVTFSNIPEGVTYTVTESEEMPDGYTFQALRYSDENQVISNKDLDEAHVVNRYTLDPVTPNVKITGTKTLVTNETSWNGQTFTVELLRIDNFADEDPVSTGLTAIMSESQPTYEIDLSSIAFTEAGTYYFRAVEVIPENRNENIAYDRTFGLFSITVGDANADGRLEIQAVNAYQNTAVAGDAENGFVLTKDFVNVVSTDRVYLDIQKHVLDAATGENADIHMGDITFGLFTAMTEDAVPVYYSLTDTHGQATLMIPVSKEDIFASADNRIVYYLREIAPAVENRVVGMNYDESWIYAIELTWDEQANQAVVRCAPIADGVIGEYALYEEGVGKLEHNNTYESNVSVEIDLSGKKTINGKDALGGREFSFTLYESTAAFVKGNVIKTVSNSGNTISFADISFTAPGVYYMVAKEDASDLGGITVDAAEYHITVEIEKYSDASGTTRLRVADGYPVVVPYGTSENVGTDSLNFNNLYTITGSGQVAFGGEKHLSGRALVAEEFTIGLYSDADCTDLIESVTNRADGTFSFAPITYTVNDLGEGYAEKTYTYYVKELPGSKGGVTYDPNVYTVTVTVSHTDGVLTVTPSANAAALQIRNSYLAKPVNVGIRGEKVLSGNWDHVADKNFTFQLFRADSHFAITDQTPVVTKTVNGSEAFSIGLSYSDGEEGTYYYVLKEDISAQAGGVGYDAGEYHITVNVSDPGDGQLVAQTTMYRPGSGNTVNATFTNTYTVEPTTITLEGGKSYINSTTQENVAMEDEMFSFLILEGEDLVATGYNLADGTIVFTPIRYTAAGTHTYSVIEAVGDMGYITYDDAVFTVTVAVTDNGDGTLTAVADYGNAPIAFVNNYNHNAAQVTINGEKKLTGDWSAVPAERKLFTFALYETDSSFAYSGTPNATVTTEAGAFTFGTKAFATAGTYYYVIRELAGEADKGITYDDTVIRVAVIVEDNGEGALIPTVITSYDKAVITENGNQAAVDGLIFTNDYQTKAAEYTPKAQKLYEGDDMQAFDFVLTADGNPGQIKQNDTQGQILFDTLYFDAPGAYKITIREQENAAWGLIKWDKNVYTITVYVEDDGAGQLFVNSAKTVIDSDKGTDDLIFRNAHHDIITQKDVFLMSDPDTKIDGKTVEKGDILLYTVTYTNYDRIPVDVTITDTIPQYTELVEGSAGDGVYADGTLTWTATNIAPDTSVTVSFQVKVTHTDVAVMNTATVLEGENRYQTNTVATPVKEDTLVKDVFKAEDPTVSIDGKKVKVGDVLLYTITYTNADEFDANVTIYDVIPEHTAYMENTADNGGVYGDGALTWELQLAAGESKTVSFQVKVVDKNADIENQAHAYDGKNQLDSNVVSNYTPSGTTPETGDDSAVFLWFAVLLISAAGMVTTLTWKKRENIEK